MALNGLLPDSALVAVAGCPGARMTPATAASWAAIRAEVFALHGWTPQLTGPLDAYRPLSGEYYCQTETFLRRYSPTWLAGRSSKTWQGRTYWLRPGQAMAAVPGTSNHGWGTTADVANLGGFAGARYRQFAAVAKRHGWSNAEGRRVLEAWHWSNVSATSISNPISGTGGVSAGSPGTTPTPLDPEDDMPTSEEIATAVWSHALGPIDGLDAQAAWIHLLATRLQGASTSAALAPITAQVGGSTLGPAPLATFVADTRVDGMRVLDIARGLVAQVSALQATIAAITAGSGGDPAALIAAAEAGARAALADLTLTVKP